jgi:tRNA pseudouridine38-40 synthase
LPPTVRVRAARQVPADWHACFDATYRRYRYTILNARLPNLFLAPWCWHRYQQRLDQEVMRTVLESMLGEHDFSAFMRAGSRRAHGRTTLQDVLVEREGDLIRVELQASGFLYGMVRLLMAQLVAVAEGRLATDTLLERWRLQQRQAIKESAPAHGLCLLRVGYPQILFNEPEWYDSQPRFHLSVQDSPDEQKL